MSRSTLRRTPLLLVVALSVTACDQSSTAPGDRSASRTPRTHIAVDDAPSRAPTPPVGRDAIARRLQADRAFATFCATIPLVSTRFALRVGCDVSAAAPQLVGDGDDAILAAIAAEGDALLWEVDNAWNSGSAIVERPGANPGVIFPQPDDCKFYEEATVRAMNAVASRAAALGAALGRRNIPQAQGALNELGAVVPTTVIVITTYIDCTKYLDGWGWGRNSRLGT
ncbi:MAG: hypothetical protein MUE41_00585 [Gemmatimonadaceae bacterium]|jgi:hypothetical protein|nr:hypothetical protein [Gemmatimonadaceae bacterium]